MNALRIGVGILAALLAACGDDGNETANVTMTDASTGAAEASTGGADTSTGATSVDEVVCHPGYETCPCMGGLCLDDLVCLSDLCVRPLADDGSEGGESTTTTTGDDSSTGSSSSDASNGSSDEESSSGELLPECLGDDNYCDDGTLQTCVGGQWEYTSCEDVCLASGYNSPGCEGSDGCECLGYADDICRNGAFNLCVCADIDFDIPCTPEQLQIFYDECWNMENTYVACSAAFPVDEYADCAQLENTCL